MVLKSFGWFLLLLPVMAIVYNIPMSLLISLYSKVKYGRVVDYHRMPRGLVVLGIFATFIVAVLIPLVIQVDPAPLLAAAFLRAYVYHVINY